MQIGKYIIYFPQDIDVRVLEFNNKLSGAQVRKIVKSEVFDEGLTEEEIKMREKMMVRSYYVQRKGNTTFIEITRFMRPTEQGKYVLPQLVVRNSIENFPCIVCFPDEGVTLIFNENGLLDSYYKERELDINDKVHYFSSKFNDFPIVIYSTGEMEGVNYQHLILNKTWKKKGVNEIISNQSVDVLGLVKGFVKGYGFNIAILGLVAFTFVQVNSLVKGLYQLNTQISGIVSNMQGKMDGVTQLFKKDAKMRSDLMTTMKYISTTLGEMKEKLDKDIADKRDIADLKSEMSKLGAGLKNVSKYKAILGKSGSVTQKKTEAVKFSPADAVKFSVVMYSKSSGVITVKYKPFSNSNYTETLLVKKRGGVVYTLDNKFKLYYSKRADKVIVVNRATGAILRLSYK